MEKKKNVIFYIFLIFNQGKSFINMKIPLIRPIKPVKYFRSNTFLSLNMIDKVPTEIYNFLNLNDLTYNPLCQAVIINSVLGIIVNQKKNLTKDGLFSSWILGILLFYLGNYKIWSTMVVYFILGNFVTKIKIDEKEKLGIAEKNNGARSIENVLGSSLVALICVLLLRYNNNTQFNNEINEQLLNIGYIASISTKLGDTFASEIGKAYGNNCYLVTNLEKVKKGTEGAISIEGTLAGLIGNFIISYYGYLISIIPANSVFIITFCSLVATTIESFLGVILQDKKVWLTNEFINLINTLIGCILSILVYQALLV